MNLLSRVPDNCIEGDHTQEARVNGSARALMFLRRDAKR
jgi:hypothetical protein